MKADKSIKLLEMVAKTPVANAWWMDDNEGAMYMFYHELNQFFPEEITIYRKVARIQSWRTNE